MLHKDYKYISIEGNIGTGKTSLCRRLEKDYSCSLVLEEFADNPFLPYFYKDPEKYAFPLELFFMTERYKQMQRDMATPDLFNQFIVSDYFFYKTLLFASINLEAEEFRIFQQLFMTLQKSMPKPDIILYLHRTPEELLAQILQRGRSFEQGIDTKYLQNIQDVYFNYFRQLTGIPILILDIGEIDFLHNQMQYEEIVRTLRIKYPKGMHHISLAQ